jgi:multisubunit Na+/H+ antiporter MnhE subunit
MIATIIGLIVSVYMGAVYDEMARLILSIIFTGLFLYLFRRYFNRNIEHFIWVSIISMLPYFVWYIFDAAMPSTVRYDTVSLMKVVPVVAIIILGLDTAFRFIRNRTF